MSLKAMLLDVYNKQYKLLVIGSFILLGLSLVFLGIQFVRTGEFVQLGVSLKGGITMTLALEEEIDAHSIEIGLKGSFPKADISVRTLTEAGRISALIIEASDIDEASLIAALKTVGLKLEEGSYSVENMGSSLGNDFFRQMMWSLGFAFVLMAVVVYVTFRIPVPSFFIVISGLSEIVSTLAVLSFLEMKLSTAGIAALLMLIGYSVDSNIVLTTKVYKRKEEGSYFERTLSALRTGMTMTAASFVAILVAYIISDSDLIKQIMFILLVGLLFDIVYTWILNAGILRWYMESKEGVQ